MDFHEIWNWSLQKFAISFQCWSEWDSTNGHFTLKSRCVSAVQNDRVGNSSVIHKGGSQGISIGDPQPGDSSTTKEGKVGLGAPGLLCYA